MDKGNKLLSEFVFAKNYAQKKSDGTLETWNESIDRIYATHKLFLIQKGYNYKELEKEFKEAKEYEKNKLLLSSQRGRQFAYPHMESGILNHHAKAYNCSSTLIDRPEVFGEIMYLLLCGAGVGFSIHKEHVNKLPKIVDKIVTTGTIYSIPDSIEGWAEAINRLMQGAFSNGLVPTFDYGQIRPKGALIDGKFKAPGPDPLKNAISKIHSIIENAEGRKLSTVECHRIICFIAQAVLSGGIRRSATLSMFDKDDTEMLNIKANSTWYTDYPELTMANNSVLIPFGEDLSYEELKSIIEYTRAYGEPGFVKVNDYYYVLNPLMLAA